MKSINILVLLFFGVCVFAQDLETNIIVELDDRSTYRDLFNSVEKNSNHSFELVKPLSQRRPIYLLNTEPGRLESTLRYIESLPFVSRAYTNSTIELRGKPDDPRFDLQWNMQKISIEQAWDYTTGGTTLDGDEIVVAIMDDGYYYEHEELNSNIYRNPHESPGDKNQDGCPGDCGVDDDGDGLIDEDNFGNEPGDPNYNAAYAADDDENGYIDDIEGLNVVNGTDNHIEKTHGTSVSSIIGAKGDNGVGIAGINWDVKMLLLSSPNSSADVIEAYEYLTEMRRKYNETNGEKGAFVVATNGSFGIENVFPEERDDLIPWCDMYDTMGEVGILSVVATANAEVNIDKVGDMPSLCQSPYMIAVTSSDESDELDTAGFGPINIDMAAPGDQIQTYKFQNDPPFGSFNGTSSATPHVAGTIGLLYSSPCSEFLDYFKSNPASVDELAQLIINSGNPATFFNGLTVSGKILDVYNSLVEAAKYCSGAGGLNIISLYPNPTLDEILVLFSVDPTQEVYFEIYNVLGKKISSEVYFTDPFEQPQRSVNVEHYPAGVYFCSIRQGKERMTTKFIKL